MSNPASPLTFYQLLLRYKDAPGIQVTERGGKQCTWSIPDALSLAYPEGVDGIDLDQEVITSRDGANLYVQIAILGHPLREISYVLNNVPEEPGEYTIEIVQKQDNGFLL